MNLRHLGADVTLWGLVGDDDDGHKIRTSLADRDVEFVPVIDPRGTERHVNLMNQEGDRLSIFLNPGSDDVAIDFDSLEDVARRADLVSVNITNHCRPLLPWLKELGKPIWVDIHDYDGANPHHTDFIEAADYLFMSSVAGTDWRTVLERRIEAGATVGVCTHGASGASGLTDDDGWVEIEATPVSAVADTNGAGDAFFAGFSVSWLSGGRLDSSMRAGADAAAAAVQSPELAPLPRSG